jgi:hypothetical protein
MKSIFYLLILFAGNALAQCNPTDGNGLPFYQNRTFLQLYNSGLCIEQDITSGPIYILFDRLPSAIQTVRYSYAGENSMTVTSIRQLDLSCNPIGFGPVILQGSGQVIIELNIVTLGIEALCVYGRAESVLSSHFGNIECTWHNGILYAEFEVLSHANSQIYQLMYSTDTENWEPLIIIYPDSPTNSQKETYVRHISFINPGQFYLRASELDFNGKLTSSDIKPFTVTEAFSNEPVWNIIGQQIK